MKILLIGSGGREHALAWSIADSPLTQQLVIAPGNPGMAPHGELIDIAADDIDAICDYAAKMLADLVVVGPEMPLVLGLVDKLNERDIPAFGPTSAAAKLKGLRNLLGRFVNAITYRNQPFIRWIIMPPPASTLMHLAVV